MSIRFKNVHARGDVVARDKIVQYMQEENNLRLDLLDISSTKDFLNIWNFENIEINDIFIEPNYVIYNINPNNYEKETLKKKDNFIDSIKDLLDLNKVLFIVGKYGAGKTILSKKIYIESQNDYNTFFINIKDVFDITDEWDNIPITLPELLEQDSKKILLIIDGLDELNIKDSSINNLISKILLKIRDLDGYKIIFITRLYVDFHQDIALEFLAMCEDRINYNKVKYIEIDYFTRSMIVEWLEKYNHNTKIDNKLTLVDIEKEDKGLFHSCQMPLYLYLLTMHYYDSGFKFKKENTYQIYELFLKKTSKGKFQGTHHAINNIKEYNDFLKSISCKIFSNNYQVNKFVIDRSDIQRQREQNTYFISNEKVIEVIDCMEIGVKGTSSKKLANSMNCYFFEKSLRNKWAFSNKNLMFYLIAEHYSDFINRLLELNNKDYSISIIGNNFNLYLDRIIFDYLIQILNQDYKEVSNLIEKFYEEKFLFNNNLKRVTNKNDIEYFLGIVYLFIKGKKKYFNHIHSFINQYIKRVSYSDTNYRDIFVSLFQGIELFDIKIKDIEISNYNFSYSTFKNVSFINCLADGKSSLINGIVINNVKWLDVKFIDSIIKNLNITDSKKSSITFQNSNLINLKFKDLEEIDIKIKNCKIHNVEFHNVKYLNIEFIDIKKNNGQSILFNHCTNSDLIFNNSDFDLVKIKHTHAYISEININSINIKSDHVSRLIVKH